MTACGVASCGRASTACGRQQGVRTTKAFDGGCRCRCLVVRLAVGAAGPDETDKPRDTASGLKLFTGPEAGS